MNAHRWILLLGLLMVDGCKSPILVDQTALPWPTSRSGSAVTVLGSEFDKVRVTSSNSGIPPKSDHLGPQTGFVQSVPQLARNEYNTALEFLKQRRPEEAGKALRRALDIFPDYFDALETMAYFQMKEAHFEPALQTLGHAVQINSRAAQSYYLAGVAHLNLAHFDECISSLKMAISIEPARPFNHLVLGYALMKKGKLEEAEEPLKTAFLLGKEKAIEAHLYLAIVYEKLGRFQESATALRTFLKNAPKGANKHQLQTLAEVLEKKAVARDNASN